MKIKLGIFDSGIGGFTVLKPLIASNLGSEVIYLADNKRNPFGNKKYEEIRGIAIEICSWFQEKNLDALLIACNTTNACAFDILNDHLKIPCFDLINSVSNIVSSNRVGILGTNATINSSFYKYTLEAQKKGIKVYQQSCPDLVTEIEKIPINLQRINFLTELYLGPLLKENVQEVILGCSHYPLIYEIIRKNIPSNIKIIDPSRALVDKLNLYFQNSKNSCYEGIPYKDVSFFATEKIDEFSLKVKNWLEINKKINLVNLRTGA